MKTSVLYMALWAPNVANLLDSKNRVWTMQQQKSQHYTVIIIISGKYEIRAFLSNFNKLN